MFGIQQTSPGGRIVRTIGIARAKAKIGLQNLAYRLVTLERMAAASGRSVPGAPKERPVHKTKHIRDNSNNDRRAAPVIDPGKTSSLFEVPSTRLGCRAFLRSAERLVLRRLLNLSSEPWHHPAPN